MSVLAVPLNAQVLQALAEEPRSLVDLRRAAGSPPQTTMRGHLRALTEAGIVARRRQPEFPGSVDLELAKPGRDLLAVSRVLGGWLLQAPDGPLQLGTPAAKSAVKALVDGWSSGIVRVLAAKPHALTELSRVITNLSYPSLERRLGAMRLAGLIEPCPGNGRGTPHRVTDWLRLAIGPLAIAARWERQHLPGQTAPIRRLDVESAFLLVLPLLSPPSEQSGECRLAVEMRTPEGELRLAGVMARVRDGEVSCVARLQGNATAWVSGSAAAWLRAVLEDDKHGLETGGDCDLALALLDGFHGELRRARQRA
ncbi:MAG: ArsR family transcriptional regulator [Thermoleophilia bacterium]|nr:ArsR family transcriptional regulator [Thermoleophilia bacterium]